MRRSPIGPVGPALFNFSKMNDSNKFHSEKK